MNTNVITLSHNIFLTKEERYAIYAGNTVETVGVTIINDNEDPTELKEVFCKYVLFYNGKNNPIEVFNEGFIIHVPHEEAKGNRNIDNDEWSKIPPKKLSEWYRKNTNEISARNLLDLKDGGDECLIYKERSKSNIHGKTLISYNYVQIMDINILLDSLTIPSHLLEPLRTSLQSTVHHSL